MENDVINIIKQDPRAENLIQKAKSNSLTRAENSSITRILVGDLVSSYGNM